LIEVTENHRVVGKAGEKFFAHLPSPPLFFLPSHVALSSLAGLGVVAAEEGIAAEDDVLRINPTVLVGI
jgi:hypothetical protein